MSRAVAVLLVALVVPAFAARRRGRRPAGGEVAGRVRQRGGRAVYLRGREGHGVGAAPHRDRQAGPSGRVGGDRVRGRPDRAVDGGPRPVGRGALVPVGRVPGRPAGRRDRQAPALTAQYHTRTPTNGPCRRTWSMRR